METGRFIDDKDDSELMGWETLRHYLKILWKEIGSVYGNNYLKRRPTVVLLGKIKKKYAASGYPGCIGYVTHIM